MRIRSARAALAEHIKATAAAAIVHHRRDVTKAFIQASYRLSWSK
jgi:hypothetical protein